MLFAFASWLYRGRGFHHPRLYLSAVEPTGEFFFTEQLRNKMKKKKENKGERKKVDNSSPSPLILFAASTKRRGSSVKASRAFGKPLNKWRRALDQPHSYAFPLASSTDRPREHCELLEDRREERPPMHKSAQFVL